MKQRQPNLPEARSPRESVRAVLVPVVFLLLAGGMLAEPWPFHDPRPRYEAPVPWVTDITPVRHPTVRPEITIGGHVQRCTDCHSLFESPKETERELTQHENISLKHGINARCFNCHHRENRDAFADDKGEPIPFDQPHILCGKCHGPVYRDWTHGVHGRTNGYWDTSRGPMDRKRCTECHDPHVPPFPPMHPAPGPNTLRMGEQAAHDEQHEGGQRNPLLIYLQEQYEEETREGR